MVAIDVVRATNARLVQDHSLVAVIIGGTSGIGEYTARQLTATIAKQSGKGLRLYIVGRNQTAADKIIADCSKDYPQGEFRFMKADDLALVKDVDRVCKEITTAEERASQKPNAGPARIDFLVMTQGFLSFSPHRKSPFPPTSKILTSPPPATSEGLDAVMSLMYYSRMRFTLQLLPLLLASPLPAHVVSVYNPNLEGKLIADDLGLRKPGNIGLIASSHIGHLNTMFMESLAAKHPGKLALVHLYPGFVFTGAEKSLPGWFQVLWRWVLQPICSFWEVKPEECGQRVVFYASGVYPPLEKERNGTKTADGLEIAMSPDGMVGGGAYRVASNGDSIASGKVQKKVREDGMVEKVWEHTMKVFETIEAGKVFTG